MMNTPRRIAPALGIAAAIAILAGATAERPSGPFRPTASSVALAPVGSIDGTVTVKRARAAPPLRVTKDVEHCGHELVSEALLANPQGGLANAVVYIEGSPAASSPGAGATLRLSNDGCAFVPHVQAAVAGGSLTLRNNDPLLHNVHFFLRTDGRRRTVMNLALPASVPRLDASRALRRPGVIEVRCDAHEWMSAWILLFDHPYFAVTDARGRFTLPDLPPGTYTLRVWHETLGELSGEVAVQSGQVTTVSLPYAG